MRITKLSLTNFRSFKETQTIEFAPVTLLFGPNSVGKSTVLMALFYLQQIIDKGQCNPQRIDALGDKFVGGFQNLVHGRDLDERITIKIEYITENSLGSSYLEQIDTFFDFIPHDPDILILESVNGHHHKLSAEFEIAWSFVKQTAYVSSYSIWVDDIFVGKITSDAGLKNPVISEMNFGNFFLCEYVESCGLWRDEMYQTQECLLAKETMSDVVQGLSKGEELLEERFSDDGFYSRLHYLVHKQFPLGIMGKAGALPILGQKLTTSLDLESKVNELMVNLELSELFVSPLDNILKMLKDSLSIGPMRMVPDSTFKPNPHPNQMDWYNGKACWDELAITNIKRDHTINMWLGEDKLDLGYKLIYRIEEGEKRFITPSFDIQHHNDLLAITDAIGIQIEQLCEVDESETTPLSYGDLETSRTSQDIHSSFYKGLSQFKNSSITLWDVHNSIDVYPSDIGVGVSQLLPLIVAAYSRNKGIIACEQPELHVHPRVQVGIGDLLTQVNTKVNFLIETHSEHLILRLLKRVRQTSAGELPEGVIGVTPEDISVIFLSNSKDGVQAKRIKITEDGDFDEEWPGGFFDERDEELF